jgi:hypothetical protein
VDELPAVLKRASLPASVGGVAEDAVTGPRDPPELLHVEVDELAWPLTLISLRLLEAELAKPAHPDLGQDP